MSLFWSCGGSGGSVLCWKLEKYDKEKNKNFKISDIENPVHFLKMDICVIVFSSFSIANAYAVNAHVVGILHKKCKSVTPEEATI